MTVAALAPVGRLVEQALDHRVREAARGRAARGADRPPDEIRVNGAPRTIVGVLPPDFRGLTGRAELWTTIVSGDPRSVGEEWAHAHSFSLVARLKSGVSLFGIGDLGDWRSSGSALFGIGAVSEFASFQPLGVIAAFQTRIRA